MSETLNRHEVHGVRYYGFPAFEAYPFVRHGFSTRLGGVSRPPYDTLNLSFTRGDDDAAVRENFSRFCGAVGLSAARLVISDQQHHTAIRNVTAADAGKGFSVPRDFSDVDGLLTDEPGITLCTQYADCVPLFFFDPKKRVVGMSHAGWRGTAAQIGAVTVERMTRDYGCDPRDILAGIAPSIGPCCFEVDRPVYEAFCALPQFDEECYRRRGEKFDLDLWEINRRILLSAGVTAQHITITDLCTRCHPDEFWSHRTAGTVRGSLAGIIGLVR